MRLHMLLQAIGIAAIAVACAPSENEPPVFTTEGREASRAMGGGGGTTQMTEEGCQLTPGCWPGGGGINGQVTGGPTPPFNFGTDPNPGSFGIWIGMGATNCYKNYGGTGADYDNDLLIDECEHRLAYVFRPELMINPADGCPGGEPYWATRYFDDPQHIGWGQFVRIAYLPAYYRDCGSGSHRGDSEMIVVTVAYNGTSRHWELTHIFLSAHFMNPNDNSDTFGWNDITYPSGIPKSYPRV